MAFLDCAHCSPRIPENSGAEKIGSTVRGAMHVNRSAIVAATVVLRLA